MTFLEAAIEILRNADGPLHFSEIARQAVADNLLSHVGRDPEAAMRSCLNSAVRAGTGGAEPIVSRTKPGYYAIRPGAVLPDPPPKKPSDDGGSDEKPQATSKETKAKRSSRATRTSKRRGKRVAKDSDADKKPADGASAEATETPAEPEPDEGGTKSQPSEATAEPAPASDDAPAPARKRRRRSRSSRGEAPAPQSVAILPSRKGNGAKRGESSKVRKVEFEAPTGSGLEGVTDVAVVMANAMSRLVEERPELRDELEAMQQQPSGAPEAPASPAPPPRAAAPPGREEPADERPGRRRRRRRRRGRRVDWSSGGGDVRQAAASLADKLLNSVAEVLEEAGSRSLHVRQVAETLASKGLLGGEISEIERAVTSAVLMDIHTYGRVSRFVARGDARYQLQGTRLPESVAKAEQVVRDAIRVLEDETRAQLVQWLQSLGARALESLVRIYLQREGYSLIATLPPSRGLGKLVVEDPEPEEEDGRLLVLVIPQRTSIEPKLWEGELERNGCASLMLFAMSDPPDDASIGEARVVSVAELAAWLRASTLGVTKVSFEASVLDPTLIESIGGLDT